MYKKISVVICSYEDICLRCKVSIFECSDRILESLSAYATKLEYIL